MTSAAQTALEALWAATHATQFGFGVGSLNGISDAVTCNLEQGPGKDYNGPLSKCIPMSNSMFGLVTSIFTLGGLVGSLLFDRISPRLGRIGAFRVASATLIVGSTLVGVANSVAVMIVGRILIGIGSGLSTVAVPLYLAEIAPPAIKRALGIANQLFIVIGLLIAQSLSIPFAEYTTWRLVFAIPAALGVLQFVGSFAVENTQVKTKVAIASEESGEDTPLLENDPANEKPMSIRELLTSDDPVVRRGLIVFFVCMLGQQFCGITPVMSFSTRILKPVFSGESRSIALGIVIFKLPLTVVPAFIIEKLGPRPILLVSAAFMVIWSFLLAFGLNTNSQSASAVGMLSFVAFYSAGLGPVSWVVLSEVMPSRATTAAGALGLALNWTVNFLMGSVFLPLQEALSSGGSKGEGNIFILLGINSFIVFIAIRASYAAYDAVKH